MPLLWFPRVRYRPVGPPEDPTLREAWDLGRAQQQAGPSCPTPEWGRRFERFSARERDAYWGGLRAGTAPPAAPISFRVEVALLAVEATIQAATAERLPAVISGMPVILSIGKLRSELEHRCARELGLTSETAPQPRIPWEWALLGLGRSVYLRLRGLKSAPPTWSLTFAQSLIRELDRRQAWRRALPAPAPGRERATPPADPVDGVSGSVDVEHAP